MDFLCTGRTATPTWTEGTPSFTESTVSEFGKIFIIMLFLKTCLFFLIIVL